MKPEPLTLRTFPPEIREIIFNLCVKWTREWKGFGHETALLAALRGDPGLYQEALHILYRDNAFVLRCANDWDFGDMSQNAVMAIQRLRVDLS